MLTKSSIGATYPLAEKLAEQGIALSPVNETPLALLVSASTAAAQTFDGVNASDLETQPDFAGSLIAGSQMTDPLQGNSHDETMATTIKAVGDVIVGNLSIARNVVNPIIKQVAEEVQGHLEQAAGSSLSPLNVVPFFYKRLWDSPLLRELVDRYKETPVVDMQLKGFEITPTAGYAAALTTGIGRLDAEIADFLAQGAEARLEAVWNNLFSMKNAYQLQKALNTTYLSADDCIIAFLFARRLQDEIPEGIDMDPTAWKLYTSTIQAQAGRAVLRVLERRSYDVRTGTLVIDSPLSADACGDILVVGDVYNRWLEEGGTPEVLFGACMSDSRYGYRDLITQKEELLRVWKNEHTLLQAKAAANRFNELLIGLRAAGTKAINELSDEQIVSDRGALHSSLATFMTHVKPKHLEAIYDISRKLVCRVLFGHTDAEQILYAIDTAAAANPDLDIREAALLGVVDYTAIWLDKLIVVEEIQDTGLGL